MLLAACLTLGCQSPLLHPPHWTVSLSQLDYIQLVTGAGVEGKVTGAQVLRMELMGTGYLTYRTGKSARVLEEFWTEEQNAEWDETKSDSVVLPASYTQATFQRLVNTGFFESDAWFGAKPDKIKDGVFVVGSINGRKQAKYTDDVRIRDMMRELAGKF